MSLNFAEKRIHYLNNWPNVEPFDIEKCYHTQVDNVKIQHGTIFSPFPLEPNLDESFNKAISFLIDSVDQLEHFPNFSYEFVFKAYDCFSNLYHPSVKTITDKIKTLCDNEWSTILNTHPSLLAAFDNLLSVVPVRACQYLHIRLFNSTAENKAYQRVATSVGGNATTLSATHRKAIIDAVNNKYGLDHSNYASSIRNSGLLYRHILTNNNVQIDSTVYNISTEDKLHILLSGFLYTLRNDIMHGSSMSVTKSSKATLSTFATNYFAFLLLYYLLVILMVNKYSCDYSSNVYNNIAASIEANIILYKELFKKSLQN